MISSLNRLRIKLYVPSLVVDGIRHYPTRDGLLKMYSFSAEAYKEIKDGRLKYLSSLSKVGPLDKVALLFAYPFDATLSWDKWSNTYIGFLFEKAPYNLSFDQRRHLIQKYIRQYIVAFRPSLHLWCVTPEPPRAYVNDVRLRYLNSGRLTPEDYFLHTPALPYINEQALREHVKNYPKDEDLLITYLNAKELHERRLKEWVC